MAKESKQKVKKIRGENEPKKPTTEYFRFLRDERKQLQPGLSVKEQTQILSKRWGELGAAQKQAYSVEYKDALESYRKEMETYKETDEYKKIIKLNQSMKKQGTKAGIRTRTPRKPSGYNLFVKEERARMPKSKDGEVASFKEISQIISKKWHSLSDDEKETYKMKAKEDGESAAENIEPSE
ncbi:hypothetical protein NEFER03_0548 [Nematocida sp. LUAm3]|nr:hypothetical protein NEFER03_0548 [Nematocida sp. LUAm3]KAI5175515.1 hypothetical protein NEFER02_1421 [Nematocida sp. LUAm2]KAI5178455.1 hypothetical protein NEFER01_1602 [Nematocida sp. LUAm1]